MNFPLEIQDIRKLKAKIMHEGVHGDRLTVSHHGTTQPDTIQPDTAQHDSTRKLHTFWSLVSRIIPPRTREELFDQAYEELKREHFKDRKNYRGKWERRWLKICFSWHAFRMIAQTIKLWAWAKVAVFVKGLFSIFSS